jgi:hypothetical protein
MRRLRPIAPSIWFNAQTFTEGSLISSALLRSHQSFISFDLRDRIPLRSKGACRGNRVQESFCRWKVPSPGGLVHRQGLEAKPPFQEIWPGSRMGQVRSIPGRAPIQFARDPVLVVCDQHISFPAVGWSQSAPARTRQRYELRRFAVPRYKQYFIAC